MTQRILFVCIGNAIRSQIAEALTKTYASDVLTAASAGLAPAMRVDPNAIEVLDEIGIELTDAFPKGYEVMTRMPFDLIVNISGYPLPGTQSARIFEWEIADPLGQAIDDYRRTRDLIQKHLNQLLRELRQQPLPTPLNAPNEFAQSALARRRRQKSLPPTAG